MMIIRNEEEKDYAKVEQLTRQAFYNQYVPGCVEHYLVHMMRNHDDFIKELDFVLDKDGEIIGNIMYTKAYLVDETGNRKDIVTFGPVSIAPEYQRQGYGKQLMEFSFEKAKEMGYDTIVIMGSPANYVARGFESCMKHGVCVEGGRYPTAMMVKELIPRVLDGKKWTYYDSPLYNVSSEAAQEFDALFPPMEKKIKPSQEEFFILSHSFQEQFQ